MTRSLEVQLSGTNTLGLATGPNGQDSEGGVCAGTVGTTTKTASGSPRGIGDLGKNAFLFIFAQAN